MEYKVKKINEYTYLINDEDFCCSFVLVGKNKSLVIDAGFKNKNSLIEEIKKITKNELVIFISHGHKDHVGHLNEFDSFYIHKDDYELLDESLKNKASFFKDLEVFDFETFKIKVLFNKGHTLGSVIFIDETSKHIFTGDQFGSGCGVWMQVATATNISTYKQSILYFIDYINKNYTNTENFKLFPGHIGQEYTSRLTSYNPLTFKLIENLAILCDKLLNNEVNFVKYPISFLNEDAYYTNYENAEIVVRKSQIN